jgi:hypothetical protein
MEAFEGEVWALAPGGERESVHGYQGGDYGLLDIPEFFQLGEGRYDEEEREVLEISGEELDKLKIQADAYSFDYDEGLIALCLDLQRFAKAKGLERYTFLADF